MAQTIAWSQQTLPDRILPNGDDIGVSTRPVGLNPDGINFNDCFTNQTLRFYLIASGFASGENLAVYATISGTCTNDDERNTAGSIDCWYLGTTLQSIPAAASSPETINVRVQDLVAFQDSIPQTTSYTPQGASACSAQTTTAGATITIWFLPIINGINATGTALSYQLATDLVGPAPPLGVNIGDGDTLFVVNWTPNSDTSTAGYDVFIHELGAADAGFGSHSIAANLDAQLICPGATTDSSVVLSGDDSGDDSSLVFAAPVTLSDAESGDSGDDASADASEDAESTEGSVLEASVQDATTQDATVQDAGIDAGPACYTQTNPQNVGSDMCIGNQVSDPVLSVVLNQISTSASTSVVENEAGEVITEDAGAAIVGGGNSGVSTQYLMNAAQGETVNNEATGSFTVTGLTNGNYYAVAVSAVDAFGNVGPPSTPQACDYPAPVNDFWTVYRQDNGGAGGFCALEAVGAPVGSTAAFASLGAVAVALVRRRTKRGAKTRR